MYIDIQLLIRELYLQGVNDYDIAIDTEEQREPVLKIRINDEELNEEGLDRIADKYDTAERNFDVIYIFLE